MRANALRLVEMTVSSTNKTGSRQRRRVTQSRRYIWLGLCLSLTMVCLFANARSEGFEEPAAQTRVDSPVIRGEVEALVFGNDRCDLGAYLTYMDENRFSHLVAEVKTGLCEIDFEYGTLEQLTCDIIAGMVLELGKQNSPAAHRAVLAALNSSGVYPKGVSLSSVLRSMGGMKGVIDSTDDAVSILENVRTALEASCGVTLPLPI